MLALTAGIALAVKPWILEPSVVPESATSTTEAPSIRVAPSGNLGCVKAPSSCGYPDETNTGVRAGQSLQKVPDELSSGQGWRYDDRGWLVINEPNALVENLDLTTPIDVQSHRAVIRNVRISVAGETWAIALRHASDTTIENVTISPPRDSPRLLVGIKDIYGDSQGTRILRSNISGMSTGIQTVEGLIQGNYIHNFGYQEGDHLNGTTSNGSSEPLAILNNTILNSFAQTDAISFFQDFGIEGNRTVSGNLLAGGGYTIYGGQNPGSPPTFNIRIVGNRFSREFFPKGGYYGAVTAFDPTGTDNVWSDNIWDETGAELPLP